MSGQDFIGAHAAMAMAAAACKPLSILPPSLQTHRSQCGALNTRQRIKSYSYHRHERPFNTSFKALHRKGENARRVYTRAVPQGDGDRGKCNKEGKDENANADASLCEEKPEEKPKTKILASPDQPEPVKGEEHQQQCSPEKVKPVPTRGRSPCSANKLGLRTTTSSRDEEMKRQHDRNDSKHEQKNDSKHDRDGSKQDIRCRLKSWWRHATRPQNLLAAFLTGLLLYAFALFGWQVMVVAVDVTLFVLKCSFVALVLLVLYIFLSIKRLSAVTNGDGWSLCQLTVDLEASGSFQMHATVTSASTEDVGVITVCKQRVLHITIPTFGSTVDLYKSEIYFFTHNCCEPDRILTILCKNQALRSESLCANILLVSSSGTVTSLPVLQFQVV